MNPVKPVHADIFRHPESASLDDFYATRPDRILVSVAHCMKDAHCPHAASAECDPGCGRCELSRLKRLCADKALAFRIEVSNDGLFEFLDREAVRFDWIVGVACPFEISRLSPLVWEKYRLRQMILPMASLFCASHTERGQPGMEIQGERSTTIGRMLELLNAI